MTQIAELDRQIDEKKRQLESVHGRDTEIYTRIVGYYRSLKNWNKGKKEEFKERRTYEVERSLADAPVPQVLHAVAAEANPTPVAENGSPEGASTFIFFYRNTCPNCPAMKLALSAAPIDGSHVDVDSDEGFELARRYEILSTPHVVFLSDADEEVWRSGDPIQVRGVFTAEELAG